MGGSSSGLLISSPQEPYRRSLLRGSDLGIGAVSVILIKAAVEVEHFIKAAVEVEH